MASKSSKRKALQMARRSRHMAMVAERGGPTPETAAKLRPDSLRALVKDRKLGEEYLDAAEEISSIYAAVVGAMWRRNNDYSQGVAMGRTGGMSARVAWLHKNRYIPWAREIGGQRMPVVIDIIHDAKPIDEAASERDWPIAVIENVLIGALRDYVEFTRRHPLPSADQLNRLIVGEECD